MSLLYSTSTQKVLDNSKNFISGGSFIFSGDKGLGKCLAAKNLAANILDCKVESLDYQADYLYIEPDEGSIKIDQVREISEFISYLPSCASAKIVIIDDANSMTVATQNALLKNLEDGTKYTMFFLVSHEDSLLDTIKSRSKEVLFHPLNKEQLNQFFEGQQVNEFALKLCEGRIGFYHMLTDKKYASYLADCKEILTGMENFKQKRELLELFHCMKEKDKELFYDKYDSGLVIALFDVIRENYFKSLKSLSGDSSTIRDPLALQLSKFYTSTRLVQIVARLSKDIILMGKKGVYNKNDFFDLIKFMVE